MSRAQLRHSGLLWNATRLIRRFYFSLDAVTRRFLRILFKFSIFIYFLFCALFLILRLAVLPNVDRYLPDIERVGSQMIGRNLSISTIDASWHGLNPRLVLGNVVIRDQQGNAALVLPEVSATLSWWSVLIANLRFDQIEILDPSVDIKRDVDGKIYVAGFFLDPKKESDGKGLDWILSQHEFAIHQGKVRWTDHLRGAPELLLSDLNFVLRNHWQRHQFRLTATLPLNLGSSIDLRGNFQHPSFSKKISDFSDWTGELYANLPKADLSSVKAYLSYPADVQSGIGAVRSWVRLEKGRVADLTLDVRLVDVYGRFGKNLPVLDMAQVSGRLIASENAAFGKKYLPALFGQAGHSISLVGFSMQTRDGVRLPATTIRESFIPGAKGQPEKLELYAKQIDLGTLANFAGHLPLPADQRQMLLDLAPQGQLKEFTARWQGKYPEILNYSVKGQFANLSMQAQPAQLARPRSGNRPAKAAIPAIPGFEHMTGSVDANEKRGSFELDSANSALQLPGYFVDPLMPFDKLQMQARWQIVQNDKLILNVNKMEFQQDGMSASLSGTHVISLHSTTGAATNELDVSGKLSGFDVTQINRYIPANAPEHLRHWLSTALLGGRADDVRVRIKGDMAYFPFNGTEGKSAAKGEFLVKGNIVDGKLDFAPGHLAVDGRSSLWPIIDHINGNFAFERAKMEINGDTAETQGVALSKVKAVIPDLASHEAILDIVGNVDGSLQGMLQYVKTSPVNGWLGHFLEESRATSNAQLALKLQLPLKFLQDSKVQGVLKFFGNDALLQPGIPLISGLNGQLEFNEKGLNLGGVKASLLGGAVQASGGTQKDGQIRIKLDGQATGEGIRKILAGTAMEQLAGKINGATRYMAQINVKKHQPELIIDSSLQGIGLDFPAPLNKLGNEVLPLHFEMSPVLASESGIVRDELRLNLGTVINARYQRQKSSDKNAVWQVNRGGIGVNMPAPEPESGVHANVNFTLLDVDAWRRLVGANLTHETGAESSTAGWDLASYIEPNSMSVQTSELHIFGKKLDNVVVGASHQKGTWQANIDSTQASGYFRWNESNDGQTMGNFSARLSRLVIPQSAAADVSELLEGKNDSAQIPSLDIVSESFELFGKKLGHLELLASNLPVATGREWRINKISLKNEDAELKGTGKWSSRTGEGVSSLNYVLDISNAGKLLDRLGFMQIMRAGRGKLEGDVRWNGPPFAMDIPSMSGEVKLELATGQFLKVDPGAAKLLGVLSLQSLARRFTLDFRDVFSEGFAFDSINGTAQIHQGVARTENLKMRSLNATVLMDGSADIAKESQDLHVAVIPEINAGTASVVYALAVNPVIGLGTFLAQLFLREPLARAFTYEYQVTGAWKAPHVVKIDNKEVKNQSVEQDTSKIN